MQPSWNRCDAQQRDQDNDLVQKIRARWGSMRSKQHLFCSWLRSGPFISETSRYTGGLALCRPKLAMIPGAIKFGKQILACASFRRELNPLPLVLKTNALPRELRMYAYP